MLRESVRGSERGSSRGTARAEKLYSLFPSHGVTRFPGDLDALPVPRCGALGPTLVDQPQEGWWAIVLCRRTSGHTGHHANQALDPSRVWSTPYRYIQLEEGHEWTLKPARQGRSAMGSVDQLLERQGLLRAVRSTYIHQVGRLDHTTTKAWDAHELLEHQRHAATEISTMTQPNTDTKPDTIAPEVLLEHLAPRLPPDRLATRLQANGHHVEVCPHVPIGELDQDEHRAAWIKAGHLHVCQEPAGHRQDIPRGVEGHRCVCHPGCDTRRSAAVYGPLPPTTRPEEKLT